MDVQGPIIMINLLKFKPKEGEETYREYEEKVTGLMADKGLEIIFLGPSLMTVIGDEAWDKVFLAKYPSLATFIEMNRDPEYLDIVKYRMDALSDSRLIITQQEIL